MLLTVLMPYVCELLRSRFVLDIPPAQYCTRRFSESIHRPRHTPRVVTSPRVYRSIDMGTLLHHPPVDLIPPILQILFLCPYTYTVITEIHVLPHVHT